MDQETGRRSVFGLIPCRKCPPYESEYLSIEDTFFRTQQMADVAGFYRAFGVDPGSHAREGPDHVCLEWEFSAFLLLKERGGPPGMAPPTPREPNVAEADDSEGCLVQLNGMPE